MTARYLLDTNVISMAMASRPNVELSSRLAQHSPHCVISAPTWQELIYGARLLPAGKRRKLIENYLEQVVRSSWPILPYDDAAAQWHGEERARLKPLGKMPPLLDGEIAAIAVTAGLILVTANVRDFAAFTHLQVEDWTR